MEKCEYEEIITDIEITPSENDEDSWKPLLRQCMVCSGIWTLYFVQGIALGAPTVIVAAMRRESNSTDAVSVDISSWLSSMAPITSLPFIFILPWLIHTIGRKFTYLIVYVSGIIASILFCHSTSVYYLLISQAFVGINTASTTTFTPLLIVEYTSPKYRGIFLTIKSASTFWGIWVANAIGTFYHWKNIGIVSLICSIYPMTIILWPESPYWLAMKGRYAECIKAHRWLKGVSEASEKELAHLINSKTQSEIRPSCDNKDDGSFNCFLNTWATVTSRKFYKPALLCLLLFAQYQFTGKLVCAIYAIEVLKDVTQDESMAYKGMLILDGVTVFTMYVGCILSRYFKRRTLLFLFTCFGISFLYIISFYFYLVFSLVIEKNNVVIILLLVSFSITIGCGPMILASSIYGELAPSRYQTPIMIITGLSTSTLLSTLLFLAPYMFQIFKMFGTFLFFALASTIILIFFYFHLPETKDKTKHEIESYFQSTEDLIQ